MLNIKNQQGILCTSSAYIEQAFTEYYMDVLGKSSEVIPVNTRVVRQNKGKRGKEKQKKTTF